MERVTVRMYSPRYNTVIVRPSPQLLTINLFSLCCRRRNVIYIFIHTFTYKRHTEKNKISDKINSNNTYSGMA